MLRGEHQGIRPLQISVLGPLSVTYGNIAIAPSAAKPRTVLALLAVRASSVVAVDELVHELWSDAVPRSAKAVVQTYIMHLRKLIDGANRDDHRDQNCPQGKTIVVTRPGGYQLTAESTEVDMWQFDQLGALGHRARELGDLKQASQSFAKALEWWKGRPLLDVQTGGLLTCQAKRLEEARLNMLDRKFEVDLRLGRQHEVLGELTAQVSSYPTHEGLCAHLMLALYRSGRRAEAVAVYRQLHASMVQQQALEPSPALRRLHRSMLGSDRGSAELTDLWQRATKRGRDQTLANGRPGRISPDVAAISWDVATEPTLRPAANS